MGDGNVSPPQDGLYWGYIGAISGVYWDYIGVFIGAILGLYGTVMGLYWGEHVAVPEQNVVLSVTEVLVLYERSLRELIVAGDLASKDSRRQRGCNVSCDTCTGRPNEILFSSI